MPFEKWQGEIPRLSLLPKGFQESKLATFSKPKQLTWALLCLDNDNEALMDLAVYDNGYEQADYH